MKKIILVDGNNLLFRSFYATAYSGVIMRNSKGFPTNALYGFINMMNKIIAEESPEFILVAFDKGKTFRHDKYESYKAGRVEMPDDLKLQFPKAREVLEAMGIKHFEIDNYEADDIIGTISKIVDLEEDFDATIVSSDKDLLQLISDKVDVKLLKQSGHIRMDTEGFKNIYKVDPIRMIDLKALMGDASDHIPGVKGIGEKTAINLLEKYDNLDNLYDNIDTVTGKTREKLIADKDNAYMSYDLATIYKDVPLDFTLDDLKYNGINQDQLLNILEELEFHSLIRRFELQREEGKEEEKQEQKEITIKSIDKFNTQKQFAYYIEVRGNNYSKSQLLGVGIYDGQNGYYLSADQIQEYKELFSNSVNKYTYDLKKNIVVLHNENISINNTVFDTMIATYLLDYTVKDDISFVAQSFEYNIPFYEDVFGTEKRPKEIDKETLQKLCCEKAKFIYETQEEIENKLKQEEAMHLFEEIEMPLVEVLADMELTGIKVDVDYLKEVSVELKDKIDQITKEIYELAGTEFNISSPKQLGDVLFKVMNIPYPKKVKEGTNYSTSKEILDKLREFHPIIDKVFEYRTLTKLYTNYAIGLIEEVREDGRIHTVFNQTLTRTGRLSSVSPNLQNIPIRDDYSKLIRKAFVPDENSCLLSSDYSQIELRIFASLADAKNMIEAFQKDLDIHTQTAADVFHIPLNEVTKNERRTAKAVNFGILYGISSFGLSEDLGIDMWQAKEFINNYLEAYPGIKEFMDRMKDDAYRNGYTKTIMNRKRVIEELKNKNYMIRSQGERMALNTPIQGSAADILKKAMVDIYREFSKRNLKSKMLIQVHDELVFNCLLEEQEEVEQIVRDYMENVIELNVPLKVDIETGMDWYDVK